MACDNNIDEAAESAQHQEMAPTEHFRLRNLSAELRNRIYFFACGCDEDRKHDLRNFKTPAIAQASVQLRAEALPIFFRETSFAVRVFTNVRDRYSFRIDSTFLVRRSDSKECGTIGVKKCFRDFAQRSGDTVLFRDVTFKIYDFDDAEYVKRYGPWGFDKDFLISTLVLDASKDGESARVRVESGPYTETTQFHPPLNVQEDIDEPVGKMKTTAEEVLARDGFKGFRLEDLQQIAKALRFVMPKE